MLFLLSMNNCRLSISYAEYNVDYKAAMVYWGHILQDTWLSGIFAR